MSDEIKHEIKQEGVESMDGVTAPVVTTEVTMSEHEEPGVDAVKVEGSAAAAAAAQEGLANAGEESETIYIRNLNETIRLNTMKESLRNLYTNFGEVLDVVAHRNIRMRGQAFVAFSKKHIARRAVADTQNFPLYGQPMKVSFAKTNADAVYKRHKRTDELEKHLEERKAAKPLKRKENYIRLMKNTRAKADSSGAGNNAAPETATAPGAQAPAQQKQQQQQQLPDEYLPPNVILFLQNLPAGTTKEKLDEIFGQYPNLAEVRIIPARPDIAFVEYIDEGSSAVAKDALNQYQIDGQPIKVTFARQ